MRPERRSSEIRVGFTPKARTSLETRAERAADGAEDERSPGESRWPVRGVAAADALRPATNAAAFASFAEFSVGRRGNAPLVSPQLSAHSPAVLGSFAVDLQLLLRLYEGKLMQLRTPRPLLRLADSPTRCRNVVGRRRRLRSPPTRESTSKNGKVLRSKRRRDCSTSTSPSTLLHPRFPLRELWLTFPRFSLDGGPSFGMSSSPVLSRRASATSWLIPTSM